MVKSIVYFQLVLLCFYVWLFWMFLNETLQLKEMKYRIGLIAKKIFVIVLLEMSPLFWHFIDATAHHFGSWYQPSSPSTKDLHVFILLFYTRYCHFLSPRKLTRRLLTKLKNEVFCCCLSRKCQRRRKIFVCIKKSKKEGARQKIVTQVNLR